MSSKYAIDTETTSLNCYTGGRPFLIPICDDELNVKLIDWKVDPFTRGVFPEKEDVDFLNDLFRLKVPIKFFNAKFDLEMLISVGLQFEPWMMNYIEDANLRARIEKTNRFNYKLKPLSTEILGLPSDDEKDLQSLVITLRRHAKKLGWKIGDNIKEDYWLCNYAVELLPAGNNDAERLSELGRIYASKDAVRTLLLDDYYEKIFKENNRLNDTYQREKALLLELLYIQSTGICINPLVVAETILLMERKRKKITDKYNFNLSSPQQLSKAIFEDLGLLPRVYTDGGNPSTNEEALLYYQDVPLIKDIFEYRSLTKGLEFYTKYDSLAVVDYEGNHVIHCTFNQTNTKTFRLSASEPNLQQVSSPKTSKRGDRVIDSRKPFIPREGHRFYLYDYAGQELRLFGVLANVEFILKAAKEGKNLTKENTNRIWGGKNNEAGFKRAVLAVESCREKLGYEGKAEHYALSLFSQFEYKIVELEEFLGIKTSSTLIKIGTFTLLYGGGLLALMKQLKFTESQGKEFISDFNEGLPEYGEYKEKIIETIHKKGYIITPYNRKIDVDSFSAYKGINYSVQATAADVMKGSMLKVGQWIRRDVIPAKMLLTIHDELAVEFSPGAFKRSLIENVATLMESEESVVGIPMPVEIARCDNNWSDEKPYERTLNRS